MQKIELTIAALSSSESQTGNHVLILEDQEGKRRIPIIIGQPEAQSIAIAIEQMKPIRPMTHDLMLNLLRGLGGKLKEVLVHRLEEGYFYADLVLEKEGVEIRVDARPSDAIALAIRCDAPIFTYNSVIEASGIWTESLEVRQKKGSLAEYSLLELEDLLLRVIAKEDFESASKIRDYIESRRGEG
jgi:uncharacterized protein